MRKKNIISEQQTVASLSSLVKESDKGCVILTATALEGLLGQIHEAFILTVFTGTTFPRKAYDSLFATYGPLSSFAAKTTIALCYGLIGQDEYEGLNLVRGLRNEAAHCGFEFTLADKGVNAHVAKLGGLERIKQTANIYRGGTFFAGLPESKKDFVVNTYALHHLLMEKLAPTLESILEKRAKVGRKAP
jgi:DNA-binding MltR family transcriptional regulator